MAYRDQLAERVRHFLAPITNVEEKKMFGGLCFMVNGKMCITVGDQRLMCRADPKIHDDLLAQGATTVIMGGREYKGYVHVNEELLKTQEALEYWINLALNFNTELIN